MGERERSLGAGKVAAGFPSISPKFSWALFHLEPKQLFVEKINVL